MLFYSYFYGVNAIGDIYYIVKNSQILRSFIQKITLIIRKLSKNIKYKEPTTICHIQHLTIIRDEVEVNISRKSPSLRRIIVLVFLHKLF